MSRSCKSGFVSNPSLFRICGSTHRSKNYCIGLIFSNGIRPKTVIVFCVGASGTVPPYFVDFSVLCQYLGELINVVIRIFLRSPVGCISVPRGYVNTNLKTVFTACVGKFSYNVALAILVRTVFYRMLGIF